MSGAFPELVAALGDALAGRSVGLDGELVAAAPGRAPDFAALQRRLGTRPSAELLIRVPVNYVAFDLTWLDDEPIVRLPYVRRRELLAELDLARHPRLLVPEHHLGVDPAALLELAERHDLEGLIGKRLDSPYRPARSPAWIKVVLRRRIECVIGAWIPSRTADSNHLGALLLGRLAPPRPGGRRLRLDCVGAVGT
jgi:bifunctional non-homologous end joining protein LigD